MSTPPAEGAPPVSVVVASRDRPEALVRCLRGLEQQFHPAFEVVVVADPPGIAAVGRAGLGHRVKAVAFDLPNVSQARNLGIGAAAGRVIAFIDDDAVAEPTWLEELTASFRDPGIAAAGGYVRGRNGISFQWRAQSVDATGQTREMHLAGDDAQSPDPGPGRAIKTEGTNMAVRREVLASLGGFDPAFAFYLDETDLNLRLAARGLHTATVPRAQVHHGFLPSDRRRDDRTPRDLAAIGKSLAILLRKHAPHRIAEAHDAARTGERARLIRHMLAGRAMPGDVGRILATFDRGFAEGMALALAPHALPAAAPPAFLPFSTPPRGSVLVAGPLWRLRSLAREAARLRAGNTVVTVVALSHTGVFHRTRFTEGSWWLHRGGVFGRCERGEPLFRLSTLDRRIAGERARIASLRRLAATCA